MIINFSSLKIYGKVNIKRLNEEYIPLKQDLLGLTKYLSEKYLFEQAVNFINLRFPGVLCSTKNNPRPWLQTLINKIKNNNEVKVHNINSYFNNVIDTKEIARFILMIIKKRKNIRDTFNLSASKPLKLKSIIDIIKTKYHSKSKIKNIEKKNKSFVLSISKIKNAFHDRHKELYTYSEVKSPVELVNIESTIYGRIDRPTYLELESKNDLKHAIKSSRNLIFSETENLVNTTVYDGNKLTAGDLINGPAVIEEDTTTLVIEPGWILELHKSGTYIIKIKES